MIYFTNNHGFLKPKFFYIGFSKILSKNYNDNINENSENTYFVQNITLNIYEKT